MLVALDHGRRVEAEASLPSHTGYVCPGCGDRVILRAGRVRMAHFVHHPYVACSFSRGETVAHLAAKRLWLDALRRRGVRSDIEYPIGDQRADVVAWDSRGRLVVVELQHTSLPVAELRSRIHGYQRRGIPQLWLPFFRPERGAKVAPGSTQSYRIRPFDRYLSRLDDRGLWFYDETTHLLVRGTFADGPSRRWSGLRLSSALPLDQARLRVSADAPLGLSVVAAR